MVKQRSAPTRATWFGAVALGVVSDLTGTLGAFMPIKSIFILADDKVPPFFPAFLIDAGPTAAGLALIVLAGIFQIISAITKNMAQALSGPDKTLARLPASPKKLGKKPLNLLPLGEFGTVALIVVVVLLGSAVSATLIWLVIGWLAASAAVLAFLILRRDRRPPYPTGRAEFTAEYKKWVTHSSLWAAVAAAIVTLIVDYPALGVTGILLGAILSLRLQKAVASIAHLIVPRLGKKPSSQSMVAPTAPAKATDNPLDFIASPNGQRLLKLAFDELQLSRTQWRLVGVPQKTHASLLVRQADDTSAVLLRLFSSAKTDLRDRELNLRQSPLSSSPVGYSTAEATIVAGLPAIIVRFVGVTPGDPERPLTAKKIARWQLKWENRCVVDSDTQVMLQEESVPDPNDFLLPHLNVMASIRGPHQVETKKTLARMEELRELYFNGPRVYSFGGPASAKNMLPFEGRGFEPIDCTTITASMHGSAWGADALHGAIFTRLTRKHQALADLSPTARLRRHLIEAGKIAARRDSVALAKSLAVLNAEGFVPTTG